MMLNNKMFTFLKEKVEVKWRFGARGKVNQSVNEKVDLVYD